VRPRLNIHPKSYKKHAFKKKKKSKLTITALNKQSIQKMDISQLLGHEDPTNP